MWLAGVLCGVESMLGCRDIEIGQVGAAERGAGYEAYRQADLLVETAIGSIAPHRASAKKRYPDVPIDVHDQPVRHSVPRRDVDENSPVAERSGSGVEVEHVDALRCTVDEVHDRAARTPVDAVSYGKVAEYSRSGKCTVSLLQPYRDPARGA